MLPTKADDLAFSVLRDIYEVPEAELAGVDPAAFGERIRTIHKGFSAENEFGAIASWLGRCSLLTHPDEVLHTDGIFGVPDFLIVVNRGTERIAFLGAKSITPRCGRRLLRSNSTRRAGHSGRNAARHVFQKPGRESPGASAPISRSPLAGLPLLYIVRPRQHATSIST